MSEDIRKNNIHDPTCLKTKIMYLCLAKLLQTERLELLTAKSKSIGPARPLSYTCALQQQSRQET